MRSWIKFLFALLAALLLELMWDAALGRWMTPPNLIQLVGLGVAIRMGPRRGALVGGIAGILSDLSHPRPDGFDTMAGLATGALAGLIGRRVAAEGFVSRWAIIAVLLAVNSLLRAGGDWVLIWAGETALMAQRRMIAVRAMPGLDVWGPIWGTVFWPLFRRVIGAIDIVSGQHDNLESDLARKLMLEDLARRS